MKDSHECTNINTIDVKIIYTLLNIRYLNSFFIYFSLSAIQRKDSKRKITTDANLQLTWPHKAKHSQSQVPEGSSRHRRETSTHSAISLNEFIANATIALCEGSSTHGAKFRRVRNTAVNLA